MMTPNYTIPVCKMLPTASIDTLTAFAHAENQLIGWSRPDVELCRSFGQGVAGPVR